MAGRGATTFQKRQKEQNRKEKREEKQARRVEKKLIPSAGFVIEAADTLGMYDPNEEEASQSGAA